MFKYLEKTVTICIDRPLGCLHDGTIYLVNYGYIPGTRAEDGEEIDVYLLGVHEPLPEGSCVECKIIAFVYRYDDVEKKLVGCPVGKHYTSEQIKALLEFREKRYKHIIVGSDHER